MDDELEYWVKRWDKASRKLAEESPSKPKRTTTNNFYTDSPSVETYEEEEVDASDWVDLYRRSLTMSDDYQGEEELLTDGLNVMQGYVGAEPFNRPLVKNKLSKDKNKEYPENPIHFASVGDDQEVRVTKDFNQGKGLEKLSDLKKELESLEREFHNADVTRDKRKKNLSSQLDKLRKEVKDLSQKIVPKANQDYS